MHILRRLYWLCVLLIVGVSAQTVFAQDDPNFEIGLKPFGSYQMGNIDTINLSNGSLGVDIPLLSYPQRGGKLTLDFTLHYFNGSSYQIQACYSEPFDTGCDHEAFGSYSDFEIIDKQALTYGPALNSSGEYQPCASLAGTATVLCNYQVSNTDGASHLIAPTTAAGVSFRSIDATGILGSNALNTSFTDPEGIVHTNVQYGGILTDTRKDSNGNQITYSSTAGWTDTMGRTIPVIPPASSTGLSSCPEPPTVPLPSTSASTWSPPGPNGGVYTIVFCYATVTYTQPWAGSTPELQSVVLPNGMTWTFAYTPSPNSYIPIANLAEITFPTGGTISYAWTTTSACGELPTESANEAVLTRTMNPNDGVTPASQWSYAFTPAGTVVTDPSDNASVHTFGFGVPGTQNGCESYENQVKYYQGSSTLLKTVTTTYQYSALPWGGALEPANAVPVAVNTIWPNGQQNQVSRSYDSGFSVCAPLYVPPSGNANCSSTVVLTAIYGKELTKREYDYGSNAPGNLLRTTATSYLALESPSYLIANLLDLASSVVVTGSGAGSSTVYYYDQNNGSPQGVFGNVTSINRWLNTANTYLVTTNVYDSNGVVTTTIDPDRNPTTYGYSPSSCPAHSGYAGSGPTSVTNALRQTTYYCYDLNSGLRTSATDPNNLTVSYSYDDMLRTTQIKTPDGGQTDFSYSAQSSGWTVNIRELMNTSGDWRTSYAWVDGFGRKGRTSVFNAETTPWDEIGDTCYNGLGLVSFKADPYQDRDWSSPRKCSAAGDSFIYDALGRATKVIHADGSVLSTVYAGNSTTVTDEQGKTRESFRDGLGRLTEVIEDPGTSPHLNYPTIYSYDALDNLTSVVQAGSRQRSFVYDSLSRLIRSTNPESNWSSTNQSYVATTYVYDADGNPINKTGPAPNQQGSAQITLTYCYDALNRLTAKGYTAQTCKNGRLASAVATYVYDGAPLPPGCSAGAFSFGLAIGKRTAICDLAGSEAWSYTITPGVGWQTTDQRTTNSMTKSAIYQNNFLDSPVSIRYPSGRTVSYSYNLAGRPLSALDTATSVYYANAVHYWAGGAACWAVYGAAITGAATYNGRLQPQQMQSTAEVVPYPGSCSGLGETADLLDLTYNFNYGSGDNGNLMGITNNRDRTRSQTFSYDALNRLMTATSSTYASSPLHCWGESYHYDNQTVGGAWGNLTSIGVVSSAYNGCKQESLSVTATVQNQLSDGSTYGYDTAGNMTANSGITYTYDPENHLTATAGVTYTYDGDGKRVEKSSGKIYWYALDGSVLDETDLTGSTTSAGFSEYVFLNGRRIARRDSSNNVYYYSADHLGTSRVIAEIPSGSAVAALCYDADFYPFGGERAYATTCTQTYKFTGKERDSESNLDNFRARYDSSGLGRFMSPDPAGLKAVHLLNPQTWNWYAYTMSNPLRYTDPTGKYTCADDGNKCQTDQDRAFEAARQRDLQSKDPKVVAAAKAYGDPSKDNHVSISYVSGTAGLTTPTFRTNGSTTISVQIPGGDVGPALDAIVGHEGTHVEQDQALAATIKPDGSFDHSLNLTTYQAEFAAYEVSASIYQASGQPYSFDAAGEYSFEPRSSQNDVDQAINGFLADPNNPYKGITPDNPGKPLIATAKVNQ
jgi:RHS repeat-associated protein